MYNARANTCGISASDISFIVSRGSWRGKRYWMLMSGLVAEYKENW